MRDMIETLLNTEHITQMRQYIKVSVQEVLIGRLGVLDFTELAKKAMKKKTLSSAMVKAEGKLKKFTNLDVKQMRQLDQTGELSGAWFEASLGSQQDAYRLFEFLSTCVTFANSSLLA